MLLEAILTFVYVASLASLMITYIFYPLAISVYDLKNHEKETDKKTGKKYVIIPAYNEERVIGKKIENTLNTVDDSTFIYVVSDNSSDETNRISKKYAENFDNINFIINTERGGKNKCINAAINYISPEKNDVLIFTDCNTFFDSSTIPELLKDLQSGAALAAGSMAYKNMATDSAKSEGLYWKYEEWIRRNESRLGRLIVCNGGIFAMWAEYFRELPAYVPNDFEAPLRLAGEGQTVLFNSKAVGIEEAIDSKDEEWNRKKRMANRQMNCILYLWKEINFTTKLQVIFHKILRWFGLHIFLLATLIVALLYLIDGGMFFLTLMFIHLGIAFLILLSFINQSFQIDKWFLPKVYHAAGVHYYGASGAIKALTGSKTSIWEKAHSNR